MSRMKKQQLTKLVALYFAGSLALGGVAYAADGGTGFDERYQDGKAYIIAENVMGEYEEVQIFGGSKAADVASSSITLQSGGGEGLYLLGGGYNGDVDIAAIFIKGGVFEEVLGGGEAFASGELAHVKNAAITITGTNGISREGTDVFGGGSAEGGGKSTVEKSTIAFSGGTVSNIVGGGSAVGGTAVVNDASITVSGGTLNNVFGGGTAQDGGVAKVDKTAVNVSGGNFVIPEGSENTTDPIPQGIYGGGFADRSQSAGSVAGDTKATVKEATVQITGGAFGWNGNVDEDGDVISVYAGGWAKGANATAKVENAMVHITNAAIADVYAGGEAYANGVSTVDKSAITVGQGAKLANLLGGGSTEGGTVKVGEATLHVGNGAQVGCVQGGGEADWGGAQASVDSAKITIDGGVVGFVGQENRGVFGGGMSWVDYGENTSNAASVKNVSVHLQNGVVNGDVYGGGIAGSDAEGKPDQTAGIGTAVSSVDTSAIDITGGAIHGDVYAGGWAQGDRAQATVQSAHVTISGGTIDGTVYAGGKEERGGNATVGTATITLDVDNAAIKTDGSGAAASVLHLTDKVKTYDGKNFAKFSALEVDGTTTITGGLKDAHVDAKSKRLVLTGAGVVNADVALQNATTIAVSNGTLQANTITLGTNGKLELSGAGNLQTNSGQVFTTAATATDDAGKLTTTSGDVKDGFTFGGGTLTLDDAKYTLDYSMDALNKVNPNGTQTQVNFSGTVVNADGSAKSHLTVQEAHDLTAKGGAATSIAVQVEAGKNLSVGANTGEAGIEPSGGDLSASRLQFAGDGATREIVIRNGNQLWLKGSADGVPALVTNVDGQLLTSLEIAVGGTLKLGDAGLSGTLTANTTILDGNGKLEIAGNSTMVSESLTALPGAAITVGDSSSAGTLIAKEAKLNGATLFLDPVWQDGAPIGDASKAGLKFTNDKIDGMLAVGQNSVLSLGTTDTALAEKAFAESGLKWGEGITAAMYISAPQTLNAANGAIKVDGAMNAAPILTANSVEFGEKSLLMVDVSALKEADSDAFTSTALKGDGTSSTLTVAGDSVAGANDGAKLYLTNDNGGATYTVVDGFTANPSGWQDEAHVLVNRLTQIAENGIHWDNGKLEVTTERKKAADALPGVALPNILDKMEIKIDSPNAGVKFLSNAVHLDKDEATRQINAAARGAEGAGATRLGAVAAWDIADAVQARLSLAQENETSEAGGIWAQYIHNKDKVDGMEATGGSLDYSNSYNGIVVGGDFARQGNFQSGLAFAYGSGDGSGSYLSNDFDLWGLSYYGSVKRGDGNLLFDVGYSKTSSDISGLFEASPDTKVFTLGVRGEKQIADASGARYVPYVGLRYMNIDTGSYNATMGGGDAFHYGTDKANLWLLPIGVSISSENASGQWTVRPMADLSYVFAFGDKDSAMRVTTPGVNAADQVGYDIMDSGFFVGRLGIEASKDNQTWGLGYAYQKGSHAENNRFYANVKFSF